MRAVQRVEQGAAEATTAALGLNGGGSTVHKVLRGGIRALPWLGSTAMAAASMHLVPGPIGIAFAPLAATMGLGLPGAVGVAASAVTGAVGGAREALKEARGGAVPETPDNASSPLARFAGSVGRFAYGAVAVPVGFALGAIKAPYLFLDSAVDATGGGETAKAIYTSSAVSIATTNAMHGSGVGTAVLEAVAMVGSSAAIHGALAQIPSGLREGRREAVRWAESVLPAPDSTAIQA